MRKFGLVFLSITALVVFGLGCGATQEHGGKEHGGSTSEHGGSEHGGSRY